MLREPFLVLGGAGMVGRALGRELAGQGVQHRVVTRAEVDLSRFDTLGSAIPEGTGTVLNCAGWTNVDSAEMHEEDANRINGVAVGLLAERCKTVGAVLVHYSTDYVFAGHATQPYAVDSPRAPLNAYGRSKALGETLIEQSGVAYLLVRTSWVYAPWGKNFVRTMVGLGRTRPSLRVVSDQLGRPTSAEQLARVSIALLSSGALGTFHVSDAGQCSWFEFAKLALSEAQLTCQVEPCASTEFPSPAVRPSYSVLDLSGTEKRVGPLVPWQDSLRDVIPRLEPTGVSGR
jgi:dTDP-4-dehydrorhamnose reductase